MTRRRAPDAGLRAEIRLLAARPGLPPGGRRLPRGVPRPLWASVSPFVKQGVLGPLDLGVGTCWVPTGRLLHPPARLFDPAEHSEVLGTSCSLWRGDREGAWKAPDAWKMRGHSARGATPDARLPDLLRPRGRMSLRPGPAARGPTSCPATAGGSRGAGAPQAPAPPGQRWRLRQGLDFLRHLQAPPPRPAVLPTKGTLATGQVSLPPAQSRSPGCLSRDPSPPGQAPAARLRRRWLSPPPASPTRQRPAP